MSDVLRAELARVASRLGADGVEFVLERPRDAGHGDLATNLAMVLAKRRAHQPAEDRRAGARGAAPLARAWSRGPRSPGPASSTSGWPGPARRACTAASSTQGAGYGRATAGAGLKVNVEFVSANPTGPLHVGHGRGAALGDAIAALLEWTGHAVTREFYINDAGVQIDRLAESLWARVREARGSSRCDSRGRLSRRVLRENARAVLERGRPASPSCRPRRAIDGAARWRS